MIKTIPIALRRLAIITETCSNMFANHVDTKNVAQLPTEFFKLDSKKNDVKQEPREDDGQIPSTSTSTAS